MAKTALEGERTERELKLERDLKTRELRMAELEDENRRLKTPGPSPAPAVPPSTPGRKKSEWLAGLPFYDED